MRRRRYPSERRRPCPALCPELRIHAAAPSGPAPRRFATKGVRRAAGPRDIGALCGDLGPGNVGSYSLILYRTLVWTLALRPRRLLSSGTAKA